MKKTIRFKRTVQPKKTVKKSRIVLAVFLGLFSFFMGYMAVRPIFLLFGLVS